MSAPARYCVSEGQVLELEFEREYLGEVERSFKILRILNYLGGGGFGSVWKALDETTGRPYAVKIGHRPEAMLPSMFERMRLEASVPLDSPFLIRGYGAHRVDDCNVVLLFELLPGRTLDHWIEKKGWNDVERFGGDPDPRVEVFRQLLHGVAELHRRGTVHRDLKNGNVMICDGPWLKVIDFGISKFKEYPRTEAFERFGTPPYAAPEVVVIGARDADERADVWALGHMLFELDTGGPSVIGVAPMAYYAEMLGKAKAGESPEGVDVAAFKGDWLPNPASARGVLRRMLKFNVDERADSVEDLMVDLGFQRPLAPTRSAWDRYPYPVLDIEDGASANTQIPLILGDGDHVELGRKQLDATNATLSSRHFVIRRRGANYVVSDLGSKRGTFVNGRRLRPTDEPMPLFHTDRIRASNLFLKFIQIQ